MSLPVTNNKSYSLLSRTAIISSETNLVKFWDNNTVITALGSTTCVAHRVYMFSTGGVAIQYGQANYANMTLAKAGANLEPFVKNPVLKDATFMGWWVFEETATVTAGTIKAEFIEYTLGIQGGSSSNSQDLSGYLLNTTDTFNGVLTVDGDVIITGETKVFDRLYTNETTLIIQIAGTGRAIILNEVADTLTCTFDTFIATNVTATNFIYNTNTSWAALTLTNTSSGAVNYKVKNNLLLINGSIVASTNNSLLQIGTLPAGFRPNVRRFSTAINISGNTTSSANPITNVYIEANGDLFINTYNYLDYNLDIEITLDISN